MIDIGSLIDNEFSRNIGLLTEGEQARLLNAKVAVAGAGGVGGIHLLTLARLGVGKFNIADLDVFEPVNISRQFGAFHSTRGRHKAEVLAEMIRDINPQAEITLFPQGVSAENIDKFLEGVEVFVDGIEFFEIDIRRLVFNRARGKGIYALTAAPLGFGATLQVFSPQGMSFDDYFGIDDGMGELEKLAAFATGLAPRPYHLSYLDKRKVSVKERKGPAVAPACTLAASLVATEVVKILTGKGTSKPVPHYLQIDMLRGKMHRGYVWGGGKNPLQRIVRHFVLKAMRQASS
ncbi:MAG: ThiF family adenylyltransferase [Trichloromonas sp.]|jgi:molybdopterin/thiamine biosynthesis adenylyltransferase|nr:ThiF family adenylyltransferase [Trichloromonas sp.]